MRASQDKGTYKTRMHMSRMIPHNISHLRSYSLDGATSKLEDLLPSSRCSVAKVQPLEYGTVLGIHVPATIGNTILEE